MIVRIVIVALALALAVLAARNALSPASADRSDDDCR